MSTDEHYYFSRVVREETMFGPEPGEEDELPISFRLVKKSRCWYDDLTNFSCENSPAAKASCSIRFSNRHQIQDCTEYIAGHLSNMGVPREEHPTVVEKLLPEVQAAIPGDHIIVLVADLTVQLLGSFDDLGSIGSLIREDLNIYIQVNELLYFQTYEIRCIEDFHPTTTDRIALESFETNKFVFIPAARSSIEGLQKVRLDSLEDDAIKQNLSCSICMDAFSQGGVDRLITHLSCTHHYHVDCITRWLETSHVCPLCRYPLPSVKDEEPENS